MVPARDGYFAVATQPGWWAGVASKGGKTATLDADRLRRLARELSSIAETATGLFFDETQADTRRHGHLVEELPPVAGDPDHPKLVAEARRVYRRRRLRQAVFADPTLFGEPAWDILLDIFVADAEKRRLSVTDACIGSAVPSTTALRWIVSLEAKGLLTRENDPRDARRVWLHLTAEGRAKMIRYLNAIAND